MSEGGWLQVIGDTCAQLEAVGPWGRVRGTAYRLRDGYMVTSEHVVRGVRTGDVVRLRFKDGEREARLLKSDAEADCAVMELAEPLPQPALLPISSAYQAGAIWESYGYLDSVEQRPLSPLVISGQIQVVEGEDPQRGPAVVLRTAESPPSGFAGSPVVVSGQIIGHLKSLLGTGAAERAAGGNLYACPIRNVEALLPPETRRAVPQPPQAAYDPAWYVPREEEEQKALEYLNFPGQPVVLWAPEFFGKTWLLRHLIHRVQRQSPRSQIVAINLDLFDKSQWRQPQGLDSFLRELALHMALSLGEQPESVYREWTTPSTTANLDRVMRRLILPHAAGDKGPLVLAIDRADAVLGSPLQNTFFGILRGWAESEEPWSSLRLVLAISTTPGLLVSSQHQSPFNLTDTVELKDLHEEQTQRLAQLYQLRWGHAELETLRRWVGGHPYLSRLAMYTAVRQGVSLAQLFDPEHPASRVFDGFLARITARLRSHPERFEALQRVLADPHEDLGEAELPLMRAGLLVRDAQGGHQPRYELYRRLANKVPSGGRLSRNLPVVPTASLGLLDTGRGPASPPAGAAPTPALAAEPGGPGRIGVGQRLGPYQVVRQLGHGGMGQVYEVYNDQLKRRAALKVLHAELSNDAEMVKRFLNEARAANVVQHPGIINFYEMGQLPSGETYFIMEFIDGEPLGDRLQRAGRLAVESALRLCQQIAAALTAAHNTGVVHRDLKPDNLMLIRDALVPGGERIKVLDFGLAKVAKRTFDDAVSTERGVLMGTPLYMAPEQCRGAENVGQKADVYALGVILFELLAGRPPFVAREVGEVLAMHQRDEPPRLQALAPSLPRALYTLVGSMLAKDPDARPTMADVADALQRLEAQYSAEQSALQVTPGQGSLFRSWTLWLTLLGILLVALLPLSIQLVRALLARK